MMVMGVAESRPRSNEGCEAKCWCKRKSRQPALSIDLSLRQIIPSSVTSVSSIPPFVVTLVPGVLKIAASFIMKLPSAQRFDLQVWPGQAPGVVLLWKIIRKALCRVRMDRTLWDASCSINACRTSVVGASLHVIKRCCLDVLRGLCKRYRLLMHVGT